MNSIATQAYESPSILIHLFKISISLSYTSTLVSFYLPHN